ncbi:sigma-54-dependent transcriptional regulator [Pseudoteredinibacter isoporae]|uniref:sigma-54-dependent transcriptional regulator n=1 Tax=Pseudoteredinibacter isoporae TaxID=570281 RepID=UPI0031035111
MMDNHKILVVEDDMDLREALCDTLEMAEYRVVAAESAERALQELALHSDIHMIVSDVNMGGMSGHELLVQVRQQYAHIPMLLVTAYASVSDSVEAMRLGAVDYLVKPFQPKLLLDTVAKYVRGAACSQLDAPVAESESSQQLLRLASRVAQTDSTVLIVGESGTGKEVLARYVHDQSPRVGNPFIAINCAAIPENMLEAMLFGHEKGAYTGATSSAPGKFEQANGGTLLLDEISEMDLGLQAKLLRVLQEKEVERLGGRKTIKLDVRVIATSNRDMRHYVAEGKFREDLYYRLSVLPLQWAPLRDRTEDIIPLANKLLEKHAEKQHRHDMELTVSAQEAMLAYAWPGNVRELDNVMQRALILQAGKDIQAEDLGLEFSNQFSPKPDILPSNVCSIQQASPGPNTPEEAMSPQDELKEEVAEDLHSALLGDDLKRREFEIIVQTLKQEGGSKKNTAGRLGISPRTLRYKIARFKDLGLNVDAQLAC